MFVREHLQFDVLGVFQIPLGVDRGVAEVRRGFALRVTLPRA